MIRYDLTCDGGHGFDAWFRSSADYDAQHGHGHLSCPFCGSAAIAKALMAPSLAKAGKRTEGEEPAAASSGEVALVSDKDARLRGMLAALKKHVVETSEDVGDRFPEVARQMHVQETGQRSIRGRATPEEAKALADDGIAVQPLPYFPDDKN